MEPYISSGESVKADLGIAPKPVIARIARRFMDENPPVPATFHAVSKHNFRATFDYLDEIRVHEVFPEMKPESCAYAWAVLQAAADSDFILRMGVYGPVTVYVNGVQVARSTLYQERYPDAVEPIRVPLKKGSNNLVFRCIATPLGCGFRIGSSSYKGRRIQFFAASKERQGMGGFLYSEPVTQPRMELPQLWQREKETGLTWYPRLSYDENDHPSAPIQRIFKNRKGRFVAVAAISMAAKGNLCVVGEFGQQGCLYLDKKRYSVSGQVRFEQMIAPGVHTLFLSGHDLEFTVTAEHGKVVSVVPLEGIAGSPWLYGGPLSDTADIETLEKLAVGFVRDPGLAMAELIPTEDGPDYWHVDWPDCRIRPYNEGTNYGEWSYPLGVTLYGLLQTGRLLGNGDILAYVDGYMAKTVNYYGYSRWDQQEYGAASFHNQLTTLESLDDCGSFGSALLEYGKEHPSKRITEIADHIAAFIREKQYRLADGIFYRNHSYLPIMNQTLWADDMYMSIPFLCRYYQFSGDIQYLNDAVNQAIGFDHYLYMADLQIFSHIYDVHYHLQTKVPWGRGNGWAAFSLTELLAVMEQSHPRYEQVLSIYRRLCKGILALQDQTGMWHQVLTMPESYPETSCTAMFLYAFARGLRFGWLTEGCYRDAAQLAWNGLCEQAIDKDGNIYGVCRGSGYSFSKEYYAWDLPWNYNDTHGTGIVMLAGMELEKLLEENHGSVPD